MGSTKSPSYLARWSSKQLPEGGSAARVPLRQQLRLALPRDARRAEASPAAWRATSACPGLFRRWAGTSAPQPAPSPRSPRRTLPCPGRSPPTRASRPTAPPTQPAGTPRSRRSPLHRCRSPPSPPGTHRRACAAPALPSRCRSPSLRAPPCERSTPRGRARRSPALARPAPRARAPHRLRRCAAAST